MKIKQLFWVAATCFFCCAFFISSGLYFFTEYQRQKVVDTDQQFGNFVLLLMQQTKVQMSEAKKQLTVQTIVRVANDVFDTEQQKQSFAVLLAIESKFDRTAKSSAGAIGAAQIMPQYSKEFAQLCGIHDFVEKELYDLELNIVIGACQFKALLQSLNGNVAAALVAYNAGKHSMSLKELQGSRNMQNQESLNYVSRFLYVSERAKNDHKLASAIQEAN